MQGEIQITNIDIDLLAPNKYQPRKIFNSESIKELASSIKEYGILNPILVRKKEDKYEIIAGERRYQAAKSIGLKEVPVIIKELDDQKTAEIALIENIQRENLNPIEEAKSYKEILDLTNLTQEELANKIGKSQSFIANKIRLLSLSEIVQIALLNKRISEKHARTLLTIDKEKQEEYLNKIITNKLPVKELENLIKQDQTEADEIKLAISDIMKSIKKEEKESDNMNNGNFFPNFNNQMPTNNNVSLNNLNMQSLGGNPMPPSPETVMPTMQQPLEPQAIPEANPFMNSAPNNFMNQPQPNTVPMNNEVNQPTVNIESSQATPEQPLEINQPIQSGNFQNFANPTENNEQHPIIEPIQPLFNMELQNINPEPALNNSIVENVNPVLEETQPLPNMENKNPMPQQEIITETLNEMTNEIPNQPVLEPLMNNELVNNIPVEEPVQITQPTEPVQTIEEPLFTNQQPTEEQPITPFEIPSMPEPTYEVPVMSNSIPEEDNLTKTTKFLNENNISYKLYNNETGHCIIIEL